MFLRDFVAQARSSLSTIYPAEEANALTGILCTEYLGVQSYTYLINPGYEIRNKSFAGANEALERLMNCEPVQYVLGFCDFFGERFNVSPSVLIPRPETETLCKAAIDAAMLLYRNRSAYGSSASKVRVLDLCTGSGCIAWTLAKNVPDSYVLGADISEDALKVASSQPFNLGKGKNPKFVGMDILDNDSVEEQLSSETAFDVITCNPPYVLESEKSRMRRNVLDYEPALALFIPDATPMVFNSRIAEICCQHMHTDSVGIIEINEALEGPAADVFAKKGFRNIEVLKDIFGKNRFIRFNK